MRCGECCPGPDFRGTLSGGELMLSVWSEWLVGSWGPVANLARTADSPPIADLSIVRDGADGNGAGCHWSHQRR